MTFCVFSASRVGRAAALRTVTRARIKAALNVYAASWNSRIRSTSIVPPRLMAS